MDTFRVGELMGVAIFSPFHLIGVMELRSYGVKELSQMYSWR